MIYQRTQFPFGLYTVPNYEEVSHHYHETIPYLAKDYPLPPELPCRHPLLQRLEGVLCVEDDLPLWWNACVDALVSECPPLESLLRPLSREEFRSGSIDRQRWNQWRRQEDQRVAGQLMACCPWQKGPSLYLSRTMCAAWPGGWNGCCKTSLDIAQ